jgi:hypothetical protein
MYLIILHFNRFITLLGPQLRFVFVINLIVLILHRRNRGKIHTSTTYMYDRSLFWLGTSTSMKSGGVKLVVMHVYIFHSKHQIVIQLINPKQRHDGISIV